MKQNTNLKISRLCTFMQGNMHMIQIYDFTTDRYNSLRVKSNEYIKETKCINVQWETTIM